MSQPNLTLPTSASVDSFIENVSNDIVRKDAYQLIDIFTRIVGDKPVMWGKIIGFGSYHYKYASGREGDYLRTGFAIRADSFSIYLINGFTGKETLLEHLGKHKIGKGCLYIKNLDSIDITILEQLIKESVEYIDNTYPRMIRG
jgi:hypothetical protein